MNSDQAKMKQNQDVPSTRSVALSESELDGVHAGTGGLVHEQVHAGTVTPPRTGDAGSGPRPARPATSTRSPPAMP